MNLSPSNYLDTRGCWWNCTSCTCPGSSHSCRSPSTSCRCPRHRSCILCFICLCLVSDFVRGRIVVIGQLFVGIPEALTFLSSNVLPPVQNKGLYLETSEIRGPSDSRCVYLPNLTGVPLPQDVPTHEESAVKWLWRWRISGNILLRGKMGEGGTVQQLNLMMLVNSWMQPIQSNS